MPVPSARAFQVVIDEFADVGFPDIGIINQPLAIRTLRH